MPDDIYDYFSGNAPKKVEPIEDDELDSLDEPTAEAPSPSVPPDAQPSVEEPVESVAKSAPVEQSEEPKKEESHWDFLAGMLGIKREPKEISSPAVTIQSAEESSKPEENDIPASSEKAQSDTVPPETPSAKPILMESSEAESTEPKSDFFGFDPIPSPEDATVLKSMFRPSEEPSLFEDSDSTESESGAESGGESDFLEFEIEELDDSPYREGEEEAAGRRRRRPDHREETSEKSPARGNSRSRQRPSRDRENEIRDAVDDSDVDSTSMDSSTREQDQPSRQGSRRRRSRGRGRGRSQDQSVQKPNEPEEFVDEIGWSTPPTDSRQQSSGKRQVDTSSGSQRNDDRAEQDGSDEEERPRSRSRRRSRRRGGRSDQSRQDSPAAARPSDFDDDQFRDDETDDDFRSQHDDDEYDEIHRRPVRGRSSQTSNRSQDEVDDLSEDVSTKGKFPTWEEAISVLVESNIKNHSQSSNRGRGRGGSNRGRGKGRSR